MATSDTTVPYGGLARLDTPRLGAFVSSFGTTVVVLNTNSEQITVDSATSRDVYGVLAGTTTHHGNCRRVAVPSDYAYLDLYHVHGTALAEAGLCTTGPTVRVFGRKPLYMPNAPTHDRKWPQDIGSPYPDLLDSDLGSSKGFWVPLTKPNWTAGTPEIAFNLNDAIRTVTGGPFGTGTYHVSEPQSVFLAGCVEVLVTIDTAAVIAGTSSGCIVGCFVS